MTAVGKIFIFLVLMLSLVQGAFAIMLYSARTQWANAHAEQAKELQVARANADQFALEIKKAQADADARVAQRDVQVKKLQADAVALQKEIEDWRNKDQK